MRRKSKLSLISVTVGVLVIIFFVGVQSIVFTSSKVQITYFVLNVNYSTGSSTGGCSPPANQAFPDSATVSTGTLVEENMSLTSIVANVKCTFDSISVTTSDFQLVSFTPSLPYSISNGTSINLSLIIRTPSHSFKGPVTIQIIGTAMSS
jgi:hypothetical protein